MDFEPFEIDQEVANFLTEYKLWGSIETRGDVNQWKESKESKPSPPPPSPAKRKGLELVKSSLSDWDNWEKDDEPMGKLKPEVEEDLKKNYDFFINTEEVDDGADKVAKKLKADLEEQIELLAKRTGYDTKAQELDVDVEFVGYGTGDASISITLGDNDKEEDIDSGLSYSFTSASLDDAADSWDWAAWLGVYSSPYHDSDWIEAYSYNEAVSAIEQFFSTSYMGNEGDQRDTVLQEVWEFMGGKGHFERKFKEPEEKKEKVQKHQDIKDEMFKKKPKLELVKSALRKILTQ
jgi:hypothetical protein